MAPATAQKTANGRFIFNHLTPVCVAGRAPAGKSKKTKRNRPAPRPHTVRRLHTAGLTNPFLSFRLRRMLSIAKTAQNAPTESLYAIRTGRVCATKVVAKGCAPATENHGRTCNHDESTYFGPKNSPRARARE